MNNFRLFYEEVDVGALKWSRKCVKGKKPLEIFVLFKIL